MTRYCLFIPFTSLPSLPFPYQSELFLAHLLTLYLIFSNSSVILFNVSLRSTNLPPLPNYHIPSFLSFTFLCSPILNFTLQHSRHLYLLYSRSFSPLFNADPGLTMSCLFGRRVSQTPSTPCLLLQSSHVSFYHHLFNVETILTTSSLFYHHSPQILSTSSLSSPIQTFSLTSSCISST